MAILDASKTKPFEGGPSFSLGNRGYRAVWKVTWFFLCSWTPNSLNFWRIFVLRMFGANVSYGARINAKVRIWSPMNLNMERFSTMTKGVKCYNMATIDIASSVIVSQDAHLCSGSHNINDDHFQLIVRPIKIKARAWIAAEAFVGPGVTVGEGAVLGARGVTFKDLEPWSVYRGNPAEFIRARKLQKK